MARCNSPSGRARGPATSSSTAPDRRRTSTTREADWTRAKAELERTQARLRLYAGQDAIVDEMLQLRSPIAGIVADRAVARGQEVRPDQMLASEEQATRPLFVITDPSRLWLWLDVAEVDLAGFRPGQVLTLRARAYPDRQFQGRVDLVGASLDPATRTVRVRGLVTNPDGALKAEMYVTADVTDPAVAAPGVEVPSKAIYLDGDRRWVFVEEALRPLPAPRGDHRSGARRA